VKSTPSKVIVLVGLPGSGKSTWAAAQRETVLSSDAIRLLLSGDENNQSIHDRVFATMRFLLRQRLELGARVTILDATHLACAWRKPWLKLAERYGAAVEAVYFATPLEECLQRNRARTRVVPDAVIREMAAKLQVPSKAEGFVRVRTIRV
jgi:predicted kinase